MVNKDGEIIDLVNENDEVIGEVLKVKANQDPSLIHREIAIILFDDKNRVLFQKRSMKKVVNPGLWAISAAGHIPKGMSIEDAAHMELTEELGIDTPLIFIEKELHKMPHETHFIYWFIGKYNGGEITLEEDEVDEAKFMTREELERLLNTTSKKIAGERSVLYAQKFWKGEFNDLVKNLSI